MLRPASLMSDLVICKHGEVYVCTLHSVVFLRSGVVDKQKHKLTEEILDIYLDLYVDGIL